MQVRWPHKWFSSSVGRGLVPDLPNSPRLAAEKPRTANLPQQVHADLASVADTALGIGATAAALLGRAGVRVNSLAVGLSVMLAGVTELTASLGADVLDRGWFYGALLGSGCSLI